MLTDVKHIGSRRCEPAFARMAARLLFRDLPDVVLIAWQSCQRYRPLDSGGPDWYRCVGRTPLPALGLVADVYWMYTPMTNSPDSHTRFSEKGAINGAGVIPLCGGVVYLLGKHDGGQNAGQKFGFAHHRADHLTDHDVVIGTLDDAHRVARTQESRRDHPQIRARLRVTGEGVHPASDTEEVGQS